MGSLVPLAMLALDASRGALGANPIERVLHQTGMLALILLIASLASTPLKILTGWTWPVRLRRMLGLLAFTYALLHFLTYSVLDQGLNFGVIIEDIALRPFITVGFAALVLLVPLVITSTRGAPRRMGFVRWQRLHRLAYVAGALAVLHFVWRVKADLSEPLAYGAVLAVLFAARIAWGRRKRKNADRSPAQ